MFTWKPTASAQQVADVTAAIHALRGQITGLVAIDAGPDLRLRPGNPDTLLVAKFDDEAAWRHYQAHPLHKALVADLIDPIVAQRQAMQTVA